MIKITLRNNLNFVKFIVLKNNKSIFVFCKYDKFYKIQVKISLKLTIFLL